ncbi:MAG TPA: hypothetical protein VFG19_00785 [Geobacteraceae bacterium]|nr:hypothetical protein [Geobacteraceae bacterium]
MHANRRSQPLQKAKVIVAVYDAMGGPENPEMREDSFMASKTAAILFTQHRILKHKQRQEKQLFWKSRMAAYT